MYRLEECALRPSLAPPPPSVPPPTPIHQHPLRVRFFDRTAFAFIEFRYERVAEDAYYDMQVPTFTVQVRLLMSAGMGGPSTEDGSLFSGQRGRPAPSGDMMGKWAIHHGHTIPPSRADR